MKNSIRLERARKDLTQADLAQKTGVSRQSINAIETGKFLPSAVLAFKIAIVLCVEVDKLFELEATDWD